MNKIVPNQKPTINNQPYRIAIVGEAPGANEELAGRPFVGMSGKLLEGVLAQFGILRNACLVANVCQVRPPNNEIRNFAWDSSEIQTGLAVLQTDLADFKPNLVLCVGASALHALKGERASIDDWRGSLFQSPWGYKCLATYHPAAVLRAYENIFPFRLDIKKARHEGGFPALRLPVRKLETTLTPYETIDAIRLIRATNRPIAIDIEGYVFNMTCISIATSPDHAFIVPFSNSYWPDEQTEMTMWRELAGVLGDPDIPKILQNAMYDLFVLQYGYKLPVRGLVDDTMLKHWELLCEAPKSLGFQASIYTNEPYYKDDRSSDDKQTLWQYCCKDSCVTYEINNTLSKQITGSSKDHYELNVKLLEPLLYMEMKGISYAKDKAEARRAELMSIAYRLQWALNEIAGRTHPSDWFPVIKDSMCFKRNLPFVTTLDQVLPNTKTTCLHLATRAVQLLKQPSLSLSNIGELSVLVGDAVAKASSVEPTTAACAALNVESSDQIPDFLYRQLGLPVQYKKEKGRLTDKETTDVLALLNLYKKTNDKTLKLILTIRALRTRAGVLEAQFDPDGRIRCGYNIVGTETGRLSCYESPTGSGFNLQTVTKKDRDLFKPDDGHWLFQCDLSGADGWTVASHCKTCGDSTMFEDYVFGLKPAKLIALMYLGCPVNKLSRNELLALSKHILDGKATELNPHNWLYFGCKRVQHGSNYGMKGRTMSDQTLKDSYKLFGEPIAIEPSTCDDLQSLYFRRYPGILAWHEKLKRQLKDYGYIISANGHKRVFFGRRDDYDTFKQACADEPQNVTTYATNLAMFRLWNDVENRIDINGKVQLRIQPLHQVHDALIGQFKKEDTAWAVAKIKSYFDNPLTIAGQQVVIPFEGGFGDSWGNLKEGNI